MSARTNPVENPARGLNQATVRKLAIIAGPFGAKGVKRGQLATCSDFENRAAAEEISVVTLAVHAARRGCPVKVSVGRLN